MLSSAIVHYRFEAIHPFADGNGRTGRALALWELYRRGFDSHHIFAVDEFYWEDRPRYYAALRDGAAQGDDLTSWLEYSAEGLQQTLERAWRRIQQVPTAESRPSWFCGPSRRNCCNCFRARGSLDPAGNLGRACNVSKQGAMDLIRPLMKAGLIKRVGTLKHGRYVLK